MLMVINTMHWNDYIEQSGFEGEFYKMNEMHLDYSNSGHIRAILSIMLCFVSKE